MKIPSGYCHIIAFDIPYPPNYGGVIDVFYKIKALHAEGVKVLLHCFLYKRKKSPELEKYCEKVFYYQRKSAFFSAFTRKPYITESRKIKELLARLQQDDYPILFEGLHSCAFLGEKELAKRKKIVRPCNIEHDYYAGLAKEEKNILKKTFFLVEAFRLKKFEKILKKADLILPISHLDFLYYQKNFPEIECVETGGFHSLEEVCCKEGFGDYVLFHGDLSVSANHSAALYILKILRNKTNLKLIISGRNPQKSLFQEVSKYKHIQLIANPDKETMTQLIEQAHVHTLFNFNLSGLKLKLLQAVFQGRFVLCNSILVAGSGLEKECIIIDNPEQAAEEIEKLMKIAFDKTNIERRKEIFDLHFSAAKQVKKILPFLE